jgi:dipeptidyl aminopeptidase/acylaminoacyl peptidase
MPKRKSGKRRPVAIEDIAKLKFVRSPALSPDEETVVFVVETVSEDRKKYHSHLWRCRADGSELRQLTYGERNDSSPVFSPDGTMIAFVSKRGEYPGIHILPIDGGEARPLVEKDGVLTGLCVTPDSRSIVCSFRANDPPPGEGKSGAKDEKIADKKAKRETPVCRHITRLFYRYDGAGFNPKDGFHIWVFDVATGEGRQLTRGRFDELSPAVSPDGKLIAFVSNHRPDPDRDPQRQDLFVVPVKGGKVRRVPTPEGPVEAPSFSPDSSLIAYYGHTHPDGPWGVVPMHTWVVGKAGRPAARDLTPKFDREPIDLTISDTAEGFGMMPPHWSPDGRTLTILVSDTGATLPFQFPAKGGTPRPVFKGNHHVQGVAFGKRGRRAALLIGDAVAPSEIAVISTGKRSSRPRIITKINADWLASVHIAKPQEVWVTSTDRTRVQGWVLKPPGFRTGRKYPAVVEVHGGPRTQYGYTFFHEMQMLAAQGYVVYYCNPRGSQGRGQDFSGAIVNRWGTVDYEDVMAGTDWLMQQRYIDPKRVGVTGGSYGGYMTNWIVGHTNRFKAAVTQRSVVLLETFFGTSDLGWLWNHEFGGQPWENPEGYAQMSPLTYAKNIKTPLLIIHSENDLRCAIEQGEQLYLRLKYMRKTVELVRFPEEPHGLSRHGRPDRRIARLEHILRWFDKYLRRR